MSKMKALQLHSYGGSTKTKIVSVNEPDIRANEVLVEVYASGVNGIDWKIREGYLKDVYPLKLPTTLGIEFAGIVLRVGSDVKDFNVGDRVFGPVGGFGSYAEKVAVVAKNLSKIPDSMSFLDAAALPIAAIGAWQSLNLAGQIRPGQKVLIHGAGGALGGFAVQFAARAGAVVYAAAREAYGDYLTNLGAHHLIRSDVEQFESKVNAIDLVLDYVGGEPLSRSWSVLSSEGTVVSAASPAIQNNTPAGRRGLWYVNTPAPWQLERIALQVASGEINSEIAKVVDFDDLAAAIEENRSVPHYGKTVVNLKR